MTCDFIQSALPAVRGLSPYQGGKPIEELAREYGLQVAGIIKLASNENPLGPSPLAATAMAQAAADLHRYPDGNAFELKRALSAHLSTPASGYRISVDQITIGNGSNDVLELLARAYVGVGDEVIFSRHAFAVYPIVTQAVGGRARVIPAKNFGNDLDAMRAAVTDKTRLVFIANPNNPTGTWLPREALAAFIRALPERILMVLDEAYFEFVTEADYPNGLQFLAAHPNVVVTRTFSKIYGLAGLRIGYGVSHPQVAEVLNRVRQPFNINSLALACARAALDDAAFVEQSRAVNARGMQQLATGFRNLKLEYIPSIGNFVCVKVGNAPAVYETLLKQRVIVRPVANYELPEYLRVTVGLENENSRFLAALERALK